jgi:transcriptional regulator with XRE-family HTH domain
MPRRRVIIGDLMAQIGARIRVLRFERGLSMRALAKLSGCSQDCLVQIENGRSSINTRTMRKLAHALRVQPFDILNYDVHHDDVGYLVEKMRHDPAVLEFVRSKADRKQLPPVLRSGSSVPAEC